MLALAELVRGHAPAAHRFLAEVERTPGLSRRMRVFAECVRVYHRQALGQADPAEAAGALERLRAAHFGGLARLLARLPFSTGDSGSYAQLTAAERDILAELVRGASSKDIAARSGRSAQTVDTHIRSICPEAALQRAPRGGRVSLALWMGREVANLWDERSLCWSRPRC